MHRLIGLLVIALMVLPANARLRDYVNVARFNDTDLGLWTAGDGDLVWSDINCVASSNYNDAFNDPPPVVSPPAVHEPYQLRVIDTATAAGFHFYLNDDATNTGNARIPSMFAHRDIKVGTSFETLSDGVYDNHAHTGQFKRCNNGENSELQLTISETVLENARAGRYRARFEVEAIGGGSGTEIHLRNLRMDLEVAETVRISSLDNILLGNWDGTSDMTGSETFCVYSNNDAASYSIDASSPNEAGGSYRLANVGGTEFVGYTLEFADSVVGAATAMSGLALPGVGNNSAADCGGADNARLDVTVSALDLGVATPDSYSDTITLLVAPL